MASKAEIFKSLISQTDPYSPFSSVVNQIQYTPTRKGDEGISIGVGLGKALLSGLLAGKSRSRAREQQGHVSDYLRSRFEGDENPTFGGDPTIGANIDTLYFEEALDRTLQEKAAQRKVDYETGQKLKSDVLLDRVKEFPHLADEILASGLEADIFSKRPDSPLGSVVEEGEPITPTSKDPIDVKYDEIKKTKGKTAADKWFDQQTNVDVEVQKDEIKSTLEKSREAQDQLNELEAKFLGVKEAIENTPLQGAPGVDTSLFSGVTRTLSHFDGDEGKYDRYLKGRAALESLPALVTSLFRVSGEGIITDKDAARFIKRLPTIAKTQAENEVLYNLMTKGRELIADYHAQKADWVRSKKSLQGFDAHWNSIKDERIKDIDKTLNAFDSGGASGGASVDTFLRDAKKRGLSETEMLAEAQAKGLM